MAYPFTVGKLRASELNSAIAFGRSLLAYKLSDETISSQATLQNDDDLFLPVEANAVYEGVLQFTWQSGATPDFRESLSLPTGATANGWVADTGTTSGLCGALAALTSQPGTGANVSYRLSGVLVMSSTAGTAQWQWAQQTSDASNTIVRAGSYFKLTRIAA